MRDDPQVPYKNNTPYIWNLGSRRGSGTHWIALITAPAKGGGPALYFDPFGERPPKEILKFMRGKGGTGKVLTTTHAVQHPRSSSCGWWCVLFLERVAGARNKERAYTNFTEVEFGRDLRKNEWKLRETWEARK